MPSRLPQEAAARTAASALQCCVGCRDGMGWRSAVALAVAAVTTRRVQEAGAHTGAMGRHQRRVASARERTRASERERGRKNERACEALCAWRRLKREG